MKLVSIDRKMYNYLKFTLFIVLFVPKIVFPSGSIAILWHYFIGKYMANIKRDPRFCTKINSSALNKHLSSGRKIDCRSILHHAFILISRLVETSFAIIRMPLYC